VKAYESSERIKSVAIRLFNEKGYEATTIRDICNEIGITAPSFYYYFQSKEQLYLLMIRESAELHQKVVTEAIDSCPSQIAADRLQYIFEALLKFFQQHPDTYTFLLRNTLFPVASMRQPIREASQIWKQQFSEQIAAFLDSSQKRRMPQTDTMILIKAYHRFVVGYMMQLLVGLTDSDQASARQAWTLFWDGIQ